MLQTRLVLLQRGRCITLIRAAARLPRILRRKHPRRCRLRDLDEPPQLAVRDDLERLDAGALALILLEVTQPRPRLTDGERHPVDLSVKSRPDLGHIALLAPIADAVGPLANRAFQQI